MSYSCQVALVSLMGVGRLQSAPIPTRPGKAAVCGPILRADDVSLLFSLPVRQAISSSADAITITAVAGPTQDRNEARGFHGICRDSAEDRSAAFRFISGQSEPHQSLTESRCSG